MSIIYIYTYDDPMGVGRNIPPTLHVSSQGQRLYQAIQKNASKVDTGNGNLVLIFDSLEELSEWFTTNQITDPELLADIEKWNTAYNITHHHTFYTASPIEINVSPVF